MKQSKGEGGSDDGMKGWKRRREKKKRQTVRKEWKG